MKYEPIPVSNRAKMVAMILPELMDKRPYTITQEYKDLTFDEAAVKYAYKIVDLILKNE